jgi:hypothetical protein
MATQAESPEKMDFHIVKNMYLDIKFYIKVLNYFRIMSLVQKFIRGYDAAYTFLLHGTRVARWNISIPKKSQFVLCFRALEWKIFVQHIFWPLGVIYVRHLLNFTAIKYILVHFSRFGMFYLEKSGNPGANEYGTAEERKVECKIKLKEKLEIGHQNKNGEKIAAAVQSQHDWIRKHFFCTKSEAKA